MAEARLPVLETGRDGETGDASVERRRLLMAVGREIMPREINGRPGLPKPALESRSERFEGSSSSSSPSVVLMLRSGEVLGRAPVSENSSRSQPLAEDWCTHTHTQTRRSVAMLCLPVTKMLGAEEKDRDAGHSGHKRPALRWCKWGGRC